MEWLVNALELVAIGALILVAGILHAHPQSRSWSRMLLIWVRNYLQKSSRTGVESDPKSEGKQNGNEKGK